VPSRNLVVAAEDRATCAASKAAGANVASRRLKFLPVPRARTFERFANGKTTIDAAVR